MTDFTVTSATDITAQQIADLMTSAMEDGQCNQWLGMCEPRFNCHEDYSEPTAYGPDMITRVFSVDDDDDKYTFDRAAIQKGLQIMADQYPTHFNDLREDSADADTADAFLQCVLLGDIVYG